MYVGIKIKKLYVLITVSVFLLAAAAGVGAAVKAAAAKSGAVSLPVLMYHSVCVNRRAKGEYVLEPEKFRSDMEYLRGRGYTAVFLSEAADYANGTGQLPEKPVVITLDDGFLNNLTVVLPILEELDMKAEVNIVGEYSLKEVTAEYRSPSYSYLSPDEIKELAASGRIEIGSHTYAMHSLGSRRGCARKYGEPSADYSAALNADISRMKTEVLEPCGIDTVIFAYPFGARSKETKKLLTDAGFRIILTCEERFNEIYPGADMTDIGRFNRPASMSTDEFMRKAGL